MNFITKLFRRKPEVKVTRSSKNRDRLTAFERQFISTHLKCPDCEEGSLLEGPCGGMSMNVLCSNESCGSRFNICILPGPCVIGDRISDKSPNNAGVAKLD